MTACWSWISIFLWLLLNRMNGECKDNDWSDIDLECDNMDNISLSTIAIQTFSNDMIYGNASSYSVVSLLIEGINGLNIIPHCITMDDDNNNNHDITIDLVREWIFNEKPWPKYHEIGDLITFNNNNNNNISQYIIFNNPCILNQNKHGIILIFDQYFSSWNIQLNSYKNNKHNININTIYDTLYDNINCSNLSISTLPIKSKTNWNFELLPTSKIITNTKYIETEQMITKIIYIPFDDKNESLSAIIYILIILFLNISCGFITYLIYTHNKKKLELEIQELKSIKNSNLIKIDNNNNNNNNNNDNDKWDGMAIELKEAKISLNQMPSSPTNIKEAISETPSPKKQTERHSEICIIPKVEKEGIIILENKGSKKRKRHHSKGSTLKLGINNNNNNGIISIIDSHNDEYYENNTEYSLPSLPSIPNGNRFKRNYSFSTNDQSINNMNNNTHNTHSRDISNINNYNLLTPSNINKLSSIDTDIMSEANTNIIGSELDDSILNDDYQNDLDKILKDLNKINIKINQDDDDDDDDGDNDNNHDEQHKDDENEENDALLQFVENFNKNNNNDHDIKNNHNNNKSTDSMIPNVSCGYSQCSNISNSTNNSISSSISSIPIPTYHPNKICHIPYNSLIKQKNNNLISSRIVHKNNNNNNNNNNSIIDDDDDDDDDNDDDHNNNNNNKHHKHHKHHNHHHNINKLSNQKTNVINK